MLAWLGGSARALRRRGGSGGGVKRTSYNGDAVAGKRAAVVAGGAIVHVDATAAPADTPPGGVGLASLLDALPAELGPQAPPSAATPVGGVLTAAVPGNAPASPAGRARTKRLGKLPGRHADVARSLDLDAVA